MAELLPKKNPGRTVERTVSPAVAGHTYGVCPNRNNRLSVGSN
jgi:hypothetical protein